MLSHEQEIHFTCVLQLELHHVHEDNGTSHLEPQNQVEMPLTIHHEIYIDIVVLGKWQAACVSEIIVELTTFLPCSLMSEMEYNGECCGCFTPVTSNTATL